MTPSSADSGPSGRYDDAVPPRGAVGVVAAAEGGSGRPPLLEARGLRKRFPGVLALRDVDLSVWPGEVVGLVGENGAGKSTLAKVIAGVYRADAGEVTWQGADVQFASVREAERAGVVLIPQELQIAPLLSVAENMFMGSLASRHGIVDRDRLYRDTKHELAFFGLEADPFAPLARLATSEQRLVTIAAALSKRARLVILDEPTAALTENEAQRLFEHTRRMRDAGIACIYVSHRLDELEQVTDRVVVMRDGEVVHRVDTAAGQRREIVRAMIGREPEEVAKRAPTSRTEPVLEVSHLTVRDPIDPDKLRVDDVTFELRAGEVLGFFGLVGAGRTELARALFGSWKGDVTGDVRIDGKPWRANSPRDAIRHRVVMLTEDRKLTGIIAGQSVNANVSAASVGAVSRGHVIDAGRERARNAELIRRLDVRPQRLDIPIETLSGGNQQKVLLARWLATDPKILILDEPTLGLDIGARFEVFRLIRQLAETGRAVLLISSDLEEVVAETDRILVMYKGRLIREFAAGAKRHDLLAAATGGASA